MVPRYDIVPIPPALRGNVAPGSIMEFPFEVVESMYAFRANDVVGKISPRPLLLLHPANDSVTPTEQSIDLFRARRSADRPASGRRASTTSCSRRGNTLVVTLLRNWLDKYFPASPRRDERAAPRGAARPSPSRPTRSTASRGRCSCGPGMPERDAARRGRRPRVGRSPRRGLARRVAHPDVPAADRRRRPQPDAVDQDPHRDVRARSSSTPIAPPARSR